MQNINLQWSIFTAAAAAALDQERSMKDNDHEWWMNENMKASSTAPPAPCLSAQLHRVVESRYCSRRPCLLLLGNEIR